jgi:hypothetical protein
MRREFNGTEERFAALLLNLDVNLWGMDVSGATHFILFDANPWSMSIRDLVRSTKRCELQQGVEVVHVLLERIDIKEFKNLVKEKPSKPWVKAGDLWSIKN